MLPSPSPERASEMPAGLAGGYSPQVPLMQAAAVQIGASALVAALLVLVPRATDGSANAMAWALAQGIVALRLARGLNADPWWLPMHALFAPGLVWALGYGVPPIYPLGVFCLLLSLYWGVCRTRVPLYLSSRAALRSLEGLLPQARSFTFIDLGCGPGGLLRHLVRARPQGRYYGIEAAPVPYLLGRLRAALGRGACRISFGDYRDLDLGQYDVVYAYLSPAAMGDLWGKARREMRAGSLLISNCFDIPGVPPAASLATDARGGARLLLWRM